MYLEELKELPTVTDGEKRAVMMSAFAGDGNAQAKLVEIFLPQVVEISKLYAGQGALVEDLIGEGNVAVASAVTMLDCVEGIDEIEGFIAKMIMDAMEEYIGDDSDNRQADDNVLEKVNTVNDKARELYDSYLRKVTVKEVADELNITEDEVIEAIKFSTNHIEYIDYNEDEY
jgi:RNA polymerase primary sigma factor